MDIKISRVVKNWAKQKNIVPATSGFISPNGIGRKFAKQSSDPYWKDAFDAFGLVADCVEPNFQIFTGVHYLAGAYTHIHKDQAPEGYVHTRCNVVLKKPEHGGDPIIDGEVIPVEVGDLWLVLASLEHHGSTPINKPSRVIKSFGGLVKFNQIQNIIC